MARWTSLLLAAVVYLHSAPALAQPTDDAGEMSLEEISRMLDNPLGNLWIIFLENDLARFRGDPADGWETVNTFMVQPILPIGLTAKWNLVTRPIIPIVTAQKFDVGPGSFGDCPGNCNTVPPAVHP